MRKVFAAAALCFISNLAIADDLFHKTCLLEIGSPFEDLEVSQIELLFNKGYKVLDNVSEGFSTERLILSIEYSEKQNVKTRAIVLKEFLTCEKGNSAQCFRFLERLYPTENTTHALERLPNCVTSEKRSKK